MNVKVGMLSGHYMLLDTHTIKLLINVPRNIFIRTRASELRHLLETWHLLDTTQHTTQQNKQLQADLASIPLK